MSNAITSTANAQPAIQPNQAKVVSQLKLSPQPKAAPQPPAASATPARPSDTVQISASAKILQEASETSAQTAREAAGGDNQARRLLAREAAEHASVK
jgi:hypothetical protein